VVLEWARNNLANALASTSAEWVDIFSREASGTYTNMWMVLDTNRFVPGAPAPLPPGTLLVAEEMPGHIAVHDRSEVRKAPGEGSSGEQRSGGGGQGWCGERWPPRCHPAR
jgi:hypothetical protein